MEYPIYYGPGENYRRLSTLLNGSRCPIYCIENGWVQIEFNNDVTNTKLRGWVPVEAMYGE